MSETDRTGVADVTYDPYSRDVQDDPYPTYRMLRDCDPLHHNAERGFWALSRFDDVQAAARDWKTFSNAAGVDLPPDQTGHLFGAGNFLDADPPRHDELRDVVRRHFAPHAVGELEQRVRATADHLIGRFVEHGSADLARDLARPLPASVVCEILGLPREDHRTLNEWFDDTIRRTPGTIETPRDAVEAAARMRAYLTDAAALRRRRPRTDLLSTMVAAERSGRVSPDEVIGMCFLLFVAGILTTSGLISHALLLLARHPEQRAALVADRSRVPAAIEEVLRYESPVQFLGRVTTRDVELHRRMVPEGERLILLYASANRDERRFDDPDRFDVDRPPVRHLAFGEGIHFCLGAPLARLEARVVLATLLARTADWDVAGPIERYYTTAERGLASLPVTFSVA